MAPKCVLCGSDRIRVLPYFYFWRDVRRDLMECGDCRHAFVWPQTTDEEYAIIHGDDYFEASGNWDGGLWGREYWDAEEKLRKEARQVLPWLGEPEGRLLDIGCAGGVFLDEARKAGYYVEGIEVNATKAREARERFGLPVIRAPVEEVEPYALAGGFDRIVMMDVREHFRNPRAVLERVRAWSRPGALFLIRAPFHAHRLDRPKFFLRNILRTPKHLPGYPPDANWITPGSLAKMFELAGFEPVRSNLIRDFAQVMGRKAPDARHAARA